MRRSFFLFAFVWLAFTVKSQQTWYKRFPVATITDAYAQLAQREGGYYLKGNNGFLKIDEAGNLEAKTEIGAFLDDINSYLELREEAVTKYPFFVVAQRSIAGNYKMKLAEFIPGSGIQHELELQDSPGSMQIRSPLVLPVNDSQYVAAGHDSVWLVSYREHEGFGILWRNALPAQAVSAIRINGTTLIALESGTMSVFDDAGNLLWTKTQPFKRLFNLRSIPGGIIGCGMVNDTSGGIARFETDGDQVWFREYGDVSKLNELKELPDGGIIATGQTRSEQKILLLRCDASGNEIWRQVFERGAGISVIALSDGGFVFCARTVIGGNRLCLVKTDSSGATGAPEDIRPGLYFLKTDGISAGFLPSSVLFYDLSNSLFLTNLPGNPAVMFATAPWIGGLDAEQNLHLAADDYYMRDFRPGPSGTPENDFKRIWQIERASIDALRIDFADNGKIDGIVAHDILEWPARGNPNFRVNPDFTPVKTNPELLPAPFFDRNADHIYNVYDGDFPLIKGDRMLWWVFTDDTVHANSQGFPIVLDAVVSAYTFDCADNVSVENSVWIDFEVIKRSEGVLDSIFFGLWSDPDLGCHTDDYIGTAPGADMVFVYNQDAFDEDCGDINGFHANIPIESVAFVNHSLDRSAYANNGTVGNPPAGTLDPGAPIEYYNILNGRWRSGDTINAFNLFYPDNPADPNGSSMCTDSLPYTDRKMVYSHGPFALVPGDTFCLQTVFTLHNNIAYPCPDISLAVIPNVQLLKQWRDEGVLDAYSQQEPLVLLPAGQTITLSPTVPDASYIWSNGAQTPEITVNAPGLYTVTITNAAGCAREQTIQVNAKKPANEIQWALHPNPARDIVHLYCPDCFDSNVRLEVWNSQGILIHSVLINPGADINLKVLPAGVYFCSMFVDGVLAGSKKLVVF